MGHDVIFCLRGVLLLYLIFVGLYRYIPVLLGSIWGESYCYVSFWWRMVAIFHWACLIFHFRLWGMMWYFVWGVITVIFHFCDGLSLYSYCNLIVIFHSTEFHSYVQGFSGYLIIFNFLWGSYSILGKFLFNFLGGWVAPYCCIWFERSFYCYIHFGGLVFIFILLLLLLLLLFLGAYLVWFGLAWDGFYGISTIVNNSMPNLLYTYIKYKRF